MWLMNFQTKNDNYNIRHRFDIMYKNTEQITFTTDRSIVKLHDIIHSELLLASVYPNTF